MRGSKYGGGSFWDGEEDYSSRRTIYQIHIILDGVHHTFTSTHFGDCFKQILPFLNGRFVKCDESKEDSSLYTLTLCEDMYLKDEGLVYYMQRATRALYSHPSDPLPDESLTPLFEDYVRRLEQAKVQVQVQDQIEVSLDDPKSALIIHHYRKVEDYLKSIFGEWMLCMALDTTYNQFNDELIRVSKSKLSMTNREFDDALYCLSIGSNSDLMYVIKDLCRDLYKPINRYAYSKGVDVPEGLNYFQLIKWAGL